MSLEAFLVPLGVVALAELGDKSQLLSFMLAARFRVVAPIVAGIFVAALANHLLAGAVGAWLVATLGPEGLRWAVGGGFLAIALWLLVPDRDAPEEALPAARFGAFGTTLLAFFIAEFGDKTQVSAVALVAHYEAFLPVVAGTTLGMTLANVPGVFLGDRLAARLPVRAITLVAAGVFGVLGFLALAGAGEAYGL
ncbi:TMEM165/GDT1 family protein [Thioalkalivibrio sp. XN8]|uniref:TMEM165/GDT1 family protein n=1 Tax=Thioalkalivibrio sp. XN8 TaxID=2712863 RepID=UPI0013EA0A1D|nr:TMEM165/GDT1 family protein [Thioalkalivibrio sp. XN8]